MERSKYSFLFGGVAAAALIVVLVSARKPVPETAPKSIAWLTVDEAAAKLQQEQRPVLIDLYTTWCGWCRQMDKKTYSNKKVAEYLTG
jgi:thiol:disulfide interchange protein